MHRTLRSARPAAALALTLGAALVLPGAAFAGTTEPTPVSTTSTTSTGTTSTGTGSATSEPTGSTSATTTTPPPSDTSTTTSATGSTTTGTSTLPSTTTATTGLTKSSAAKTTSPTLGLVPGGRAGRYGLNAAAVLPETSTDPALVAAGYLVRELAAGQHHFSTVVPGFGTFADYGVTADAVLALAAAGAGQDEAALTTAYLANHVVDYVGFGDPNEIAAGAVAKLLNVAIAQGVDPTAFGGQNLVATLQAREAQNGRFSDQSQYGDFSNTFGQSLALIGLHRAAVTTSAPSRAYLLTQQCSNGGFLLFMTDAGCTDPASADPDATAMAVQALIAIGGATAQVSAGLDYLATRQAASGGVGGGGPQTGLNANTTGLAGQAFLAGGRSANARRAASFVAALQYGCTFPAGVRGGIAYDQTAYDDQADAGTAAAPVDQDRRSTSQAALALAGTPLYAVSAVGADATAPELDCPAVTTSTTTSSTSSTSSNSAGTSTTAAAPAPADPSDPGSAVPGNLAFTGADVAAATLLGALLLLTGAGAIVLARRKGVHA